MRICFQAQIFTYSRTVFLKTLQKPSFQTAFSWSTIRFHCRRAKNSYGSPSYQFLSHDGCLQLVEICLVNQLLVDRRTAKGNLIEIYFLVHRRKKKTNAICHSNIFPSCSPLDVPKETLKGSLYTIPFPAITSTKLKDKFDVAYSVPGNKKRLKNHLSTFPRGADATSASFCFLFRFAFFPCSLFQRRAESTTWASQ